MIKTYGTSVPNYGVDFQRGVSGRYIYKRLYHGRCGRARRRGSWVGRNTVTLFIVRWLPFYSQISAQISDISALVSSSDDNLPTGVAVRQWIARKVPRPRLYIFHYILYLICSCWSPGSWSYYFFLHLLYFSLHLLQMSVFFIGNAVIIQQRYLLARTTPNQRAENGYTCRIDKTKVTSHIGWEKWRKKKCKPPPSWLFTTC